ncbi:MAG TPA: hypothetical protein VNE83_07500 [Terriglobales bacterium]|nr:hypothetical protein [Terriglobales bacterium]
MDVSIGDFNVAMEIKSKGIELKVARPNGGGHRGNLVVTGTTLKWFNGKTTTNPKTIKWDDFIDHMNSL